MSKVITTVVAEQRTLTLTVFITVRFHDIHLAWVQFM